MSTGDTVFTSGATVVSRRASTSFSVSWVLRLWAAAPPRPPTKPPWVTVIVFVPSRAMLSATCCDEPVPTATSTITEPTPIMMPSIVRAERSLLADRPRSAMRSD